MASSVTPHFQASLARTKDEVAAAQRLRHDIFIREMGAQTHGSNGLDCDAYDAHADHLILRDLQRPDPTNIIGVYRLIPQSAADALGGFYSQQEFDLRPLLTASKRRLELGRSCLHPAYRGGAAMVHLWDAVARYVAERDIDLLFGVASFPGTDPTDHVMALSHLHHAHLAPTALRPLSHMTSQPDLLPAAQIDRVAAMRATPALIKAYLRRGGVVGQGCFVDQAFNTTDICMVLDAATVTARQRG